MLFGITGGEIMDLELFQEKIPENVLKNRPSKKLGRKQVSPDKKRSEKILLSLTPSEMSKLESHTNGLPLATFILFQLKKNNLI